ncbi:FAD-dependent monooxygenase [Actinoplanes sp. URMC 104]|uniref:FAD-dependent monooxygenase n=1 Tax=Actinoplanes sp. URMC 104 TaxID=3423409 RepID=UPI003F1CBBA7
MSAHIVVVGAGIGGLAAAAALGRRGVHCLVVERSPVLSPAGGGIQIAPNGSAVLHRLGLAGPLGEAARPVARELRRWRDDRPIATVPLGAEAVRRHGSPYYALRRATLARMLLQAAQRHAEVRFGTPCVGVTDRGDQAVVLLGDGTRLTADAVVGADGLHSVVRRAVLADRPRSSGFVAFRGTVRARSDRVVVRLGPGRHVVSYPLDGDAGSAVVAVVPEPTAPPAARGVPAGEVLAGFPRWHRSVRDLLTSVGRFGRHPLLDRPRPAWRRGRIVLLGDAAHPVLPFLAQGACLALEDAEALAEGLEGYQTARAARVDRVAAAGSAGIRELHLPDGPAQRARDDRLAAAGPDGHDWLYGRAAA